MSRQKSDPIARAFDAYKVLTPAQKTTFHYVVNMTSWQDEAADRVFTPKPRVRKAAPDRDPQFMGAQ